MAKTSVERGKRVVILTDRVELLSQAGGTLSRVGLQPEMISAGTKYLHPSLCYVAMVETLNNRMKLASFRQALGHVDLLIIDECHKGNFLKLLPHFPDTYVVGVTATPISARKDSPLCDHYTDIVCPVSIADLIEGGFLCPAKTYVPKEALAPMKSRRGEYTDESQMKVFSKMYDGVVEQYEKIAGGTKALIFCVNQEHTQLTAQAFEQAGHRTAWLTSDSTADRAQLLEDFSAGRYDVLCNCGILTTGYDEPSIETIILNRKTKSLPLYMQMCGRGSRRFQEKRHFTIIDMGANFSEHGLWQQEMDWEDKFRNPKRPGAAEGVAPVKECPSCGYITHMSSRICPDCQYVWPAREAPELKRSEAFVEIPERLMNVGSRDQSRLPVADLLAVQEFRGYKPGWVVRVLVDRRDRAGLEEYARHKGYKPGWATHRLRNANPVPA